MLRDILEQLLRVYGPAGNEGRVAQAVSSIIKDHVDELREDVMGNLIAVKRGADDKRILFSAHMDHIGFVVTDVEEEGFLRVSNVGGINAAVSLGRHVTFGNGVEGALMSQPLKEGETRAMKHLFVDIGAQSREEALQKVRLGDMCVYAPDVFALGEHRLASPAMDDRCACALLAALLCSLDKPAHTIVAVFSAQEEVGLRGAATAAYAQKPDLGVALDVTAWGDTPETKNPAIRLGEGPAVKIMDASMIATPFVRDALLNAASAAGVRAQREVLPFGGTDGAAIQRSRGGVPAGTLSIPCRYVHSACEVIDMRDMDGALKLLKAFVDTVQL